MEEGEIGGNRPGANGGGDWRVVVEGERGVAAAEAVVTLGERERQDE